VLHQHVVLEHGDLRATGPLTDDHRALDALATGEELRLGDDLLAPAGLAPVATALLLGLEPGRALDRGDLVVALTTLADLRDGARRVVGRLPVAPRTTAPPATTTARRAGVVVVVVGMVAGMVVGVVVVGTVGVVLRVVVGAAVVTTLVGTVRAGLPLAVSVVAALCRRALALVLGLAATATATSSTPTALASGRLVLVVVSRPLAGLVMGLSGAAVVRGSSGLVGASLVGGRRPGRRFGASATSWRARGGAGREV
jgi:hypothetical protein